MKKILITGSRGMLGTVLCRGLEKSYQIYETDIYDGSSERYLKFDLCSDVYTNLVNFVHPEVIVHCAGIIDMDFCERNPERAVTVNSTPSSKLSTAFPDAKLIYISTDAVFDGTIEYPSETDRCNPLSEYGRSKYLGELNAIGESDQNCSLRVTPIDYTYLNSGKGFLAWLIDSLRNKKPINLYTNRFFTPVTTWDLASAIDDIIKLDLKGIYNIGIEKKISRYELGMRLCQDLGLDSSLIKGVNFDSGPSSLKRSSDQSFLSTLFFKESSLPTLTFNNIVYTIKKMYEEAERCRS